MKRPNSADKKKEEKKVDVESLLKEKADVENMMAYLEDDYRKANVSEKSYAELKEKHVRKLEEINKKLNGGNAEQAVERDLTKKDAEETEEEEKEEEEAKKEGEGVEEKKTEPASQEKPKLGLFKKIFGKKEERVEEKPGEKSEKEKEEEPAPEEGPVFVDPLKPPSQEQPQSAETATPAEHGEAEMGGVEIEKLKVMIDAIREAKQGTDETIRTLSESIGEIRSMVFQADAGIRESMLKMEKIEDDLTEIKPQEIAKRFRETNDSLERHQITIEKLEKKSEDLAEKTNKVYEMLKGIGNVENIANISQDVQKKLEDIKEAVKYIERLAAKTEKIFVDLNRNLEDFVIYKAKQDDLDESFKEIIKTLDALNVKFESYVSKKDLDTFREENLVTKKQIEEINKVLPMVQIKLPENVTSLRQDREDIMLFLDSLEEQFNAKKISKDEYENIKKINKGKLLEIEKRLKKEWEGFEQFIKIAEKEGTSEPKLEEIQVEPEKIEETPEPKEEERKIGPKEVERGEEEIEKHEDIPIEPKTEEIPKEATVAEPVEEAKVSEKHVKKVEEHPVKQLAEKEKAVERSLERLKKKYEKKQKIVRKSKEEILSELKKMKI